MKPQKPKLPTGTRDFGPETMIRRTYMLDIIKSVFQKYGFAPMETPAMEQLSTLTGKYGDEGEQLIFKILDSGDFLKGKATSSLGDDYKTLGKAIAQKGLRYDLTIPLARYIAQHRHEISYPFKRFQIQPVWRADRPQKGRYREFYQCDADIIGGDSLFYETEMLTMIHEVLERLGIHEFVVQLNHRLIFKALAEKLGILSQEQLLCVTLDKLEKIGWEKVAALLKEQGIPSPALDQLQEIMRPSSTDGTTQLKLLGQQLGDYPTGQKAVNDLQMILSYMQKGGHNIDKVAITPTLARGMGYYTGAIFEVKIPAHPELGSVSAGGRYDELATVFGLPPLPSIGFSFGLERIYEVLLQKDLFPTADFSITQLLLVPMTTSQEAAAMTCLSQVRAQGIRAELYPAGPRLKKILSYAHNKKTPWVGIIGEDEAPNTCMLKNMQTGQQIICNFGALADTITKSNH